MNAVLAPVPLLAPPGATELVVILAIVLLIFGAKKLPDLARAAGQSLRIFKSETKGLLEQRDLRTRDGERAGHQGPIPPAPLSGGAPAAGTSDAPSDAPADVPAGDGEGAAEH